MSAPPRDAGREEMGCSLHAQALITQLAKNEVTHALTPTRSTLARADASFVELTRYIRDLEDRATLSTGEGRP